MSSFRLLLFSVSLSPPLSLYFLSSDYFVCELALRCNDVPWASQIMEEIVEVRHYQY